jgi:hypothetical protein
MISPDSPRRYVVNDIGIRVMLGLTGQETKEFESLDRLFALAPEPDLPADATADVDLIAKRWLELYAKHDTAWRDWSGRAPAASIRG